MRFFLWRVGSMNPGAESIDWGSWDLLNRGERRKEKKVDDSWKERDAGPRLQLGDSKRQSSSRQLKALFPLSPNLHQNLCANWRVFRIMSELNMMSSDTIVITSLQTRECWKMKARRDRLRLMIKKAYEVQVFLIDCDTVFPSRWLEMLVLECRPLSYHSSSFILSSGWRD